MAGLCCTAAILPSQNARMTIEIEPPVTRRYLRVFSMTLIAVFGAILYIAVDFARVRGEALPDAKPNFLEYIAGSARAERKAQVGSSESVAAIGQVPGAEALESDVVPEDVKVTSNGVSSWFRMSEPPKQARIEFTCVTGVGGSKICTSEKVNR